MITIASVATFSDRIGIIEDTINSLVNQVDLIFIYANDYPSYVNARKILHGNVKKLKGPDLTDRGKFFICSELQGQDYVFFACDDDLIYPPDYVKRTCCYLQQNDNKVILSYHGKKLTHEKLKSYYQNPNNKNDIINYRCLGYVDQNQTVDIIGTGVMAFHVPYFCPLNLKQNMMADIEISILAKNQNKKLLVAAHEKNWIKYNPKMTNKWTIWDHFQQYPDTLQTKLVNENF